MRYTVFVSILFALTIAPSAGAQTPEGIYAFDLDVDETSVVLEPGAKQHDFAITFTDHSKDTPDGITGQDLGIGVYPHRTSWKVETDPNDDLAGWSFAPPPPIRTFGGETEERTFSVKLQPTVIRDPVLNIVLNATTKHGAGESYSTIGFTIISGGPNTFNALLQGAVLMKPNEIGEATIRITNSALLPREFIIELGVNECNLGVGYEAFRVVPGKATGGNTIETQVTILGPDDKFWYSSEICDLEILVYPKDEPQNVRSLGLNPMITGTQVDPVWIFNTVGILVAAFIIFLLIARRKARIEEEILGRPQKPWLIPVEQVYLEHLRERDPQAHYVVRHFLMEEEYASSLLWYKDFKKATKGNRSKERLVVSQEHKYERFQKKWQRRVAAPHKSVDRLETRLQKKLDRQGKAGARKERRNWKKLSKKMRAAHETKVAKATKKWEGQVAKWEKQAAKAEKKGMAVPQKPAKPVLAEPDYPPEPTGDRILLSQHKWNKKVVKARAKATKETGNLEVKFEKKDAKMLRKVRRKVTKIARKLDDPEFANEHPLLADSAES